jgi:hypothetical protein
MSRDPELSCRAAYNSWDSHAAAPSTLVSSLRTQPATIIE